MPLKRPTTTPLPDEIYDEWAPRLGEAELKVLLYITRRTLGFKKEADAISLSQFLGGIVTRDGRTLDKGCGVKSRPNVVRALKSLERKGLIHSYKMRTPEGDNDVTVYALWWEGDEPSPSTSGEGSSETTPRWFRGEREVVSQQNHGGVAATPTTNSRATDSHQQDRSSNLRGTTHDAAHRPIVEHPNPTAFDSSAECQPHSNRLCGEEPAMRAHAFSTVTTPSTSDTESPTRRQRRVDPDYQALVVPVTELARELGDEAPTPVSVTRAYNLMREAAIRPTAFIPMLYEVAALTHAHQAHVTKRRSNSDRSRDKNLMPYFFAVVKNLLHSTLLPHQEQAADWSQCRHSQGQVECVGVAESPDAIHERQDRRKEDSAMAPGNEGVAIWQDVLDELTLMLSRENYDTWLAAARVVALDDGVLRVAVPEPFQRDWLDHKLRRRIESTMQRVGHGHVHVDFIVNDE